MTGNVIQMGEHPDPEQRLRDAWAESLASHMKVKGLTPKGLRHELAKLGYTVSRQAVEAWLAAKYAPRPHMQAAVAAVLQVPTHHLFPIDRVA